MPPVPAVRRVGGGDGAAGAVRGLHTVQYLRRGAGRRAIDPDRVRPYVPPLLPEDAHDAGERPYIIMERLINIYINIRR